VRTNFPAAGIIVNEKNEGFAGGYNRVLQQVKADYYVLLNSDVAVEPGWLDAMIKLLEENTQAGIVQPKILDDKKPDHFEYAGASGGWIDRWGFAFARGRVFDTCEADTGQYDDPQPVFWASGAALCIRASLYHELGGLDTTFFAHQEEIDLCWRAQRAGYSVWVCPQSRVRHLGGGTLAQGSSRKVYLNFRNNLKMMAKNLHPDQKYSILFFRLCLDGVAAVKFLLGAQVGAFWAVFKAHWHFFTWCWKKKEPDPVRSWKKLSELTGAYKGSIVWAYFINRKKTFSSIVFSKR
jgi:GT2 family glycosyltransferase